jgi:signal transduction histidine kinase
MRRGRVPWGVRGGRVPRGGRSGQGPLLSLVGAGFLLVVVVLLGAGPAPARSGSAPASAVALRVAVLAAGLLAAGYGGWALWRLAVARRVRAARAAAELAARAVAAERLRIARELHDVVAHSMGVIAVKAGTARYLLDSRPEEAGRALEVIETASRGALGELRSMLGLLRPGLAGAGLGWAGLETPLDGPVAAGPEVSLDELGPGELEPLPDLGGLPGLAEHAGAAGVVVHLDLAGLPAVPAGVGLSAYRIVQEALTNVVKHAAPATCRVRVHADGSAVRIEVRDDGGRCAADGGLAAGALRGGGVGGSRSGGARGGGPRPGNPGAGNPGAGGPGPGHGLIGMRERAELHGGTFSAGPAAGGGFAVLATLPLEPT